MKVMEKQRTNYNEVADELVEDFRAEAAQNRQAMGLPPVGPGDADAATTANLDERNVRRRVYDALNVLIALGIITKQKKDIFWRGLPTTNAEELAQLEVDSERKKQKLFAKRRQVRDLIMQQLSFRRLVQRNKLQEDENRQLGLHLHTSASGTGVSSSSSGGDGSSALGPGGASGGLEEEDAEGMPLVPGRPKAIIRLPFVTISTSDTATIQLDIDAPDRKNARATFDESFVVHDEKEILRQMRMNDFSEEELKRYVPEHLQRYVLLPLEDPVIQPSAPGFQAPLPIGAGGGGGGGVLPRSNSAPVAIKATAKPTMARGGRGGGRGRSGRGGGGVGGGVGGVGGGGWVGGMPQMDDMFQGVVMDQAPILSPNALNPGLLLSFPAGINLYAGQIQAVARTVIAHSGAPPSYLFSHVSFAALSELADANNADGSAITSVAMSALASQQNVTLIELMLTTAIRTASGLVDEAGNRIQARMEIVQNALTSVAFGPAPLPTVQLKGRQDSVRWATSLIEAVVQLCESDSNFYAFRAQHIVAPRSALGEAHLRQLQDLRAQWQPTMNEQSSKAGVEAVQAEYKAAQLACQSQHMQELDACTLQGRSIQEDLELQLCLRVLEAVVTI